MTHRSILLLCLLMPAVSAFSQSQISDTDGNTKVQTEALPNEDKIRMSLAGNEHFILKRTAGGHPQLDLPDTHFNLFIGRNAGNSTSSGGSNLVVGNDAFQDNTTGSFNIAIGPEALHFNTTGFQNLALGAFALQKNTGGGGNSAVGQNALQQNTTGGSNSAFGQIALLLNTTGDKNTALGASTLTDNINGQSNSATGFAALSANTSGNENTATGAGALKSNTTGTGNVAVGANAGDARTGNTNCTFLGFNADGALNHSNSTAIGNGAIVNANNKIRLGNTAVTVIEGQVPFTTSDGRFKNDVQHDAPGLDFILQLEPVTYHFDYPQFSRFLGETSVDPDVLRRRAQQREMGFIAQDVETLCQNQGFEVSNLLHTPENAADNYALAYGQLVVPLVQAVQEQQAQIGALQTLVAAQQAQIEALQKLVMPQTAASQTPVGTPTGRSATAWPNPASDLLQIRFNGSFGPDEPAQITLTDLAGRPVLRQSVVANGQTTAQLSLAPLHLKPGNYALSIQAGNGELLFSGLIAKH